MTDLEEEQPTQAPGRRDWEDKGRSEASIKGDANLTGDQPLVPTDETVAEEHKGKLDGNPGGTLEREGE